MSVAAELPVELRDRLHAASVSVVVDQAPDWASVVRLASDLVAAGFAAPATVEMAAQSPSLERPEAEPLFHAMLLELGLPLLPPAPAVLAHLVDMDDYDTLSSIVTVAEIAAAWLRDHNAVERGPDGLRPDAWASSVWYSSRWYADETRVRLVLIELLAQAENDHELARIAAGPLENIISDDEATLRWVEEHAASSPKLRTALTHAWLWNSLSPEAFSRIERAAQSPLPRPS